MGQWFLLKWSGILLTAFAGMLIGLILIGSVSIRIHDLSWRVFILPAFTGETVIELSPFGSLTARTHQGPVGLHLRLEQVGTGLVVKDLWKNDNPIDLMQDVEKRIPHLMTVFFLRQTAAAFFGAGLLVLLVWRPRFRVALGTGLAGAVLVGASLLTGMGTFNVHTFQEPQYQGVIAQAPDFIRLANESAAKFGEIRAQTDILVDNMLTLFAAANASSDMEKLGTEGDIQKILLVSDVHSNPLGVDLMKSLIKSFKVDIIIDAGDLTDFGTPLENKTAQEISQLGIPYVFSPGNHETAEMVDFLKTMDNVIPLEGSSVNVHGIRILGSSDPLSASPEVEIKDSGIWNRMVNDAVSDIEKKIQQDGTPDILVIHNPQIGRKLAAFAPLIVSGHTHWQAREAPGKESILLNPGTTGAAGMRGMYSGESIPYSAIIIHFSKKKGILAADFIQYDLLSQRFSLERRLEKAEGIMN